MSKYYYNKDYFQKIDTAEKAYWLGFLYADGCIVRFYENDKLRSMSLQITLSDKDYEHLKKFQLALETNVPIKEKTSKYKDKGYSSSRITINCTKMCYDLISKGCTPQKTYSVQLPAKDIVPEIYMKDFIRGFFDGDGCIHIGKMNNKPHIEISITGIESMLREINDYLFNQNVINVKAKILQDQRSNASNIFYYGDSVKDFLDYIYKDCNVYLSRKYEAYKKYYEDYELCRHGVYWHSRNKAYVVTITVNGKRIRVGQSKDLIEAIKMRKEAERQKTNNELMPT